MPSQMLMVSERTTVLMSDILGKTNMENQTEKKQRTGHCEEHCQIDSTETIMKCV